REGGEEYGEGREVFREATPAHVDYHQQRREEEQEEGALLPLLRGILERDVAGDHRDERDAAVAEELPSVIWVPLRAYGGREVLRSDLYDEVLVEQLKIFREVRVDDEAEQRADDDEADRHERTRDLAVLQRAFLPERHAEPEVGGHAEQEDHVVREHEDERERQEPDV